MKAKRTLNVKRKRTMASINIEMHVRLNDAFSEKVDSVIRMSTNFGVRWKRLTF